MSEERLDDETERLFTQCYALDGDENSHAFNALRSRIRTLVDEAEKASWLLGYDEGFEAGEIGVSND